MCKSSFSPLLLGMCTARVKKYVKPVSNSEVCKITLYVVVMEIRSRGWKRKGETGFLLSPSVGFCPENMNTFIVYVFIYIAFRDRRIRVSNIVSLRSILNALDAFHRQHFYSPFISFIYQTQDTWLHLSLVGKYKSLSPAYQFHSSDQLAL